MPSIIFYSTDKKYLNKTIDSLLDTTPASMVDEIIVCDDSGEGFSRPGITVLVTKGVGKSQAWNKAAEIAVGKSLVFLRDKTKFTQDWIQPLLAGLEAQPESLFSPIVHTLDLGLWSAERTRWKRFGWRWDMNIHDRMYVGKPDSPAISDNCIACQRTWFLEIGGFDEGMGVGGGADIELSLRSWLFGGAVYVCDGSSIAVALEVDYSPNTVNNLARIIEAWMPGFSSHFYNSRRITPAQVDVGRLGNLVRLQEKQKRSVEWFLSTLQPELFGIYNLRATASKKSVAVVGPGPSLDYVNAALIGRHDVIIGVDYVGLLFDCDYVMTSAAHVAIELQAKYEERKFVVPVGLENRTAGSWVASGDILPMAMQFEFSPLHSPPLSVDPPFCDFENCVLSAIQFALFLNPASITVFGCDNKILDGKSHTSKIEYYDGGKLWGDGEATRRRFAMYEYALDQLGRLALAAGVPLIRVCHA